MATSTTAPAAQQHQTQLWEPAGTPPAGVSSDFQNPSNLNTFLILTLTLVFTFGTLAVLIRMYTKLFIIRFVAYEDCMFLQLSSLTRILILFRCCRARMGKTSKRGTLQMLLTVLSYFKLRRRSHLQSPLDMAVDLTCGIFGCKLTSICSTYDLPSMISCPQEGAYHISSGPIYLQSYIVLLCSSSNYRSSSNTWGYLCPTERQTCPCLFRYTSVFGVASSCTWPLPSSVLSNAPPARRSGIHGWPRAAA